MEQNPVARDRERERLAYRRIVERLTEQREDYKVPRHAVAEVIGVNFHKLSRFEKFVQMPNPVELMAWARSLGGAIDLSLCFCRSLENYRWRK